MEVTDEQISIPNFSQGWITNMSYVFDALHRIIVNLSRPRELREKLPARASQEVVSLLVSIITYKWANKKNLSLFLKEGIKKKGNTSAASFLDVVKGWGTPAEGNLAASMANSIYHIASSLASHDGISAMMNKSVFLAGSEVRGMVTPPRQIVEKVGRATRVVARGEINVLRYDNIRFLLPSERNRAKSHNESADVENNIREFDAKQIDERDYHQLLELLRVKVDENANLYFKLRRLARQRLYAVKEVKREAKQPDLVPDSDFASNDYINSVCKQAESIIIDIGRKRSIIERLQTDPVSTTFEEKSSNDVEVNLH
jgi:hypothetical protein